MPFDVRLPIGLLFLAIGVLVAGYGLAGGPATVSSAGVNIDLVWGAVMAAFGLAMLALAALARRKTTTDSDATRHPPLEPL